MRIVLPELLLFALAMLSLPQRICSMASSSSPKPSTESNSYLRELDDYLPQFLSGNLPMKEQIDFIQTVIDLDLQDRYHLHQECKYFVLEGMCYEVSIGND